jgi:hypothetical protein
VQPFISESKDGYRPSDRVVRMLQSRARKLGLVWDWPTIAVLENHDLLLDCSHVTGDNGADLIACKEYGKWGFKIDGDYAHGERVPRKGR